MFRHLHENRLKFTLHYGKTKLVSCQDLAGIDIVLTTYHTVSAEWKHGKGKEQSILFSGHWRRIVLDEGEYFEYSVNMLALTTDISQPISSEMKVHRCLAPFANLKRDLAGLSPELQYRYQDNLSPQALIVRH